MKGIMIYETPLWGNEDNAVYTQEVTNASYTLKQIGSDDITCYLEGIATKEPVTKATCSKEDTYDFETGALIALMKMCGLEKSAKAYAEIFDDTAYGDALIERDKLERELNELKKDFDKVRDLKDFYKKNYNERLEEIKHIKEKNAEIIKENSNLKYIKSCNEFTIKGLENTRDLLTKENEKLKSDKDKSWKNYQRKIQKKQDRINELEAQITASEDDKQKNIEYYEKKIKRLNNVSEGFYKFNNRLIDEIDQKNHEIASLKEIASLNEEVEKLKLDCEKLQHGYNDMIFCGGRQNGKQYTLLVDLFKKIDQKKVDAAYKEAYNTTLPVWQKEALRQAYEIRKESKEKPDLPRTLDINGTVYRKSIQIKDFGEEITKLTVDSLIEQSRDFRQKCVDEWIKPPTKREEMWGKILEASKCPPIDIKVAKQDITTFLRELQDKIPEVRWNGSKCPPAELSVPDWFKHDYIYFTLNRNNYIDKGNLRLTYNEKHDSWIEKSAIIYLPPMRWDLFKKGRLVVKVNSENYKEFYEACEKELGKKPSAMYTGDFTVSICKKDGFFEIFTIEDQKKTGRKIVDWEDVK